jgi:membrane protein
MFSGRIHDVASKSPPGRVLVRLVQNLDRHDTPRVASAMAFDAFLSLIPLVAIAGYILQRLHQSGGVLITSLFKAAPPPVSQLVDLEFLRLSDVGASALAPISLTAFLWVSSSGLATAMGVIETIYASELRPWWVRRAIAMACVVGGFIAIAFTAALGLGVASLTGSFVGRIISLGLPIVIVIALVAAFYRIAIRRSRLPHRRILPGAVVTVILWAMASALFSLYVTSLAQYATLYGNLATVAILLLWLWLLAMALIVGSEVNAELERHHDAASSRPVPIATASKPPPPATASKPPPAPVDADASAQSPIVATPIPVTLPAGSAVTRADDPTPEGSPEALKKKGAA